MCYSDGGRSSEFRGPEESDELDYLPAKHHWLHRAPHGGISRVNSSRLSSSCLQEVAESCSDIRRASNPLTVHLGIQTVPVVLIRCWSKHFSPLRSNKKPTYSVCTNQSHTDTTPSSHLQWHHTENTHLSLDYLFTPVYWFQTHTFHYLLFFFIKCWNIIFECNWVCPLDPHRAADLFYFPF